MATILVVDDRAINRQLLVTLLGYGGHRLLEASDGAEALGIVHAERPELVITDILMPTMDGLEFAQRLRADPAIAHTAIIFYTATFRLREAQALARSCGVSHIIPKPADPALILKTVHATLGLSAPEMPAAIAPTDETGGVALGARLAGSLEDAEALNRQMAAAIGQDAAPSAERDRLRRLADKLFASLSDMQAVGLRLATMHELGLELAVEREPLRLLVVFCRAARNILSAKYAGVGVLDGDGQHVRHFVARGYEVETEARLSESMASVGMLGLLATEPRPCRLRDLGGDAQRAGLPAAHPPIDSFLAVPIASPARVYGWLYLAGKLGAEEFSQDDERVAAALAAQVALAYENVSLYEEIQRQAAQLQHEVSERKQAEESLKRTTAELRLLNDLVEQSTQPFAVADLQAQLVRFNRAYVQLTGYTADELRGMPYMQLIPERWHELANQQISELLATGQTVRLELELLRKGGAQIPVEVVVDIYRNAAGEPEYLCAFTTDITERQRAEEARHQSEKRYRALIEHSADAIALLDANGLTVYASPAITGVLGYAVEEYVGRSGLEFVHPDDLPAAARTLAQLTQQPNASAAVLVRQRHKDGSWRWLEGVATNLLAEPGVQAVVANFHDVTERRLAEQRLYLQSAAMEAAANAIVIADRDGRITWVNPAFTQLTGYALEEVQGQNPRFLKSGQQDQAFYKKLWETVLAGQVWHGEIVNRRKDGRLYTEEMTITPVADEGGSIAYFVAIKQDITERKRAEAALRAAQERLQHVTASSPAIIYALKIDDSAFLPSWVSENITDLLGYEAPEALAPGWWIDHVHPDDQARVLSEQSRPFPGDRLLREYRMRHKDGAHRWIRDEARLLRDAAGQPVEAIGSWSDISERKRAEEALESVSSQLKTLFDNLDEVFFSLDAVHWKVILVSPACEKVYGRPQQAFLDNPVLWQEVVHPEDRARMEAGQAVLFAGKPFYNEYRIVRPDGEIRWVESRVKPSQDATGKVIRLDGVVSDVTERKRADEALRQSEVRFRALIENAPDAIALLGMDGKLQYASPSTRHILGYAPEDVVGADPAAFTHPDDLPGLLTRLNDLIQKPGHVVVTQYRFRHLDGSWRWLESAISNLLAEPSVNAIVFNYRDITEHKQVEDQIRKLSRAVEQASSIVMITNLRGTIEYVNPKFTQITGYMPEEVIGTDTHRLGEMASRDGERMQSALSASGEWRGEFFNIKKNGERFWEAASISVIRDDHGDVTHYLKVAEDVTERKRVDESLQQTTAELRFLNDLVEQATQPFAAADLDGRFIRFNHALAQLTGYSGDELRGMTFRQLTAEDRQEHESQQIARLMATGQAVRYESECQRKDGSRVPVEMVVDLYRNAAGEPEYFYAFITDITERKRAEETLRYQLEIDELVATISTNFIYFTLDEIDTGIDRALESVGAFVDVDGGDVFHFNDDGARLDNLHAWRAAGPAPGADRRPPIPVDSLAWCRERLNRFEVIHVSRAEDLPHEARALLASLDGAGAKSLMIVPLAFGKVLVGFLIFISVRREKTWSDDDVRLVKLIGEIFVNALVRKQARAALEQERALLAQRVAERTADLSAANAALARAARLKDEFLASMSHELRTPLNAILGLSEALQEQVYGLLNADQLKTLRTIEDSGRHLLDLINDILDLSKVEAGKLELQVGPVEIETVCQASLRLIREAANKKRLKVHSVFDSTLTTIHADERRLTQILVNLLSNAVKFTPEGGSIGLEVADESERSVVRFTVWDTGIGISEGDIRQLFQPFVQLDSSLARQQSGTGLGLSLTQRMVEMHGGSVRVESEVDRGSRFSIYLPSQLPEVAASPLGAAQPKASSAPPIPGIRRAFVVEDSPMAADQLARYLAELGVETIAHTTAADVVERVRASQPDVILLDILLPDPAGWDALAQLKADVRTRDIPVVITSVVDDPARGRALGAAEYLVKPISRQQLRAALNRARPEAERTAPTAPAGTAARETVVQPLILLAEDNANNIQTLSDYLQAKRYRVIVARNGSEAIERAAEEMPNLILMDMQMPGMDGLEATRRIRADADLRHIPIIALTALAMPGDRERCLEAGANEYLSKPISLKQLVGAMEAQLHRDSTERGGAA